MPQPIRTKSGHGFSARYEPFRVLERPNLAAKIGLVSTAWSGIEERLAILLSIILNPSQKGRDLFGHAILNSVISIPAKINIFNSVIRVSRDSRKYKVLVDRLLPEVRTRAEERNRVIHAIWGVSISYPNDLIALPTWDRMVDPPIRYTEKDFDDIFKRITDTNDKLKAFHDSLIK